MPGIFEPLIRELYAIAILREDEINWGHEFNIDQDDIDEVLGFEELDHDFTHYKDKMLSIETIQSHIGGASKGRCLNTTAFPGSDHNAQTSNHYKVVTTMLIHTWTYKLIKSMQITCMPNTQPMHNTLIICIWEQSYKGTRVTVLKMENAWHLVRSIDLTKYKGCIKHGTNYKAYKIWKQILKAYKSNMCTNTLNNLLHK